MAEAADGQAAARERLLEALGVRFDDVALFERALCHPSQAREQELDPLLSNERLEYLGDAVLQLAVTEELYRRLPTHSEGELTSIRSFIVRGRALARAATELGLPGALILGAGADRTGGRRQPSVLACGLEAIFGAVYLDQGWDAARTVIVRVLDQAIDNAIQHRHRNYKGELQEHTQGRLGAAPAYRLVETIGPPHARRFVIEVSVGGRVLGRGEGASKKDAQQRAAEQALQALDVPPPGGEDDADSPADDTTPDGSGDATPDGRKTTGGESASKG